MSEVAKKPTSSAPLPPIPLDGANEKLFTIPWLLTHGRIVKFAERSVALSKLVEKIVLAEVVIAARFSISIVTQPIRMKEIAFFTVHLPGKKWLLCGYKIRSQSLLVRR